MRLNLYSDKLCDNYEDLLKHTGVKKGGVVICEEFDDGIMKKVRKIIYFFLMEIGL